MELDDNQLTAIKRLFDILWDNVECSKSAYQEFEDSFCYYSDDNDSLCLLICERAFSSFAWNRAHEFLYELEIWKQKYEINMEFPYSIGEGEEREITWDNIKNDIVELLIDNGFDLWSAEIDTTIYLRIVKVDYRDEIFSIVDYLGIDIDLFDKSIFVLSHPKYKAVSVD